MDEQGRVIQVCPECQKQHAVEPCSANAVRVGDRLLFSVGLLAEIHRMPDHESVPAYVHKIERHPDGTFGLTLSLGPPATGAAKKQAAVLPVTLWCHKCVRSFEPVPGQVLSGCPTCDPRGADPGLTPEQQTMVDQAFDRTLNAPRGGFF